MRLGTRDVILEYLSSMNDFVSGEEIGKIAHCTPQTVSYHIKRLRRSGIDIEVSHRGYRYDRTNESALSSLSDRFGEMGYKFEYIRVCLNLTSVIPKEKGQPIRALYYTYSEADFFCGESSGNLSFVLSDQPDTPVKEWIKSFLSTYLDSELSSVDREADSLLVYRDYAISRILHKQNIFSVQLSVNSHQRRTIDGIGIKSLSEITGDFIGLKGFSVLIFGNLYANLRAYLVG